MSDVTIVSRLSQLALFADLDAPALERLAHSVDEETVAPGQRALREGVSGSGLYLILDGEASVIVRGTVETHLGRGDFFGEISVLTGGAPMADVRADTLLRCLVVPGPEVEPFLLEHPTVMLRMLKAEALRLRNTMQWH